MRVRACNGVGCGEWSSVSATVLAEKPGQVGQPTLQPGSRSITASWTLPSDGGSPITTHHVQKREKSDDWPTDPRRGGIRNCRPPAYVCPDGKRQQEVIPNLEPGKTYYVRVSACNVAGCGPWSPSASATVPAEEPGAVGGLRAKPGDRSITVTWTVPRDGGSPIIRYESQEKESTSSTWRGGRRAGQVTRCTLSVLCMASKTITGLENSTSYDVQIRACNTVGCGPWSASVTATPAGKPGQVDAPTLTADGVNRSITARWRTPDDGGSPINRPPQVAHKKSSEAWPSLLRSDSEGKCLPPVCGSGTDGEHTITGLENGETYDVRVRVCNAIGCGTWSPSSSIRVPPTTPGPVRKLTGEGIEEGITVRWTAPLSDGGSPITGYESRHEESTSSTSPSDQGSDRVTRCPPSNACGVDQSETITGLEPGETYVVGVRACNSVGCGDWEEVSVTVPGSEVPDQISDLRATPGKRSITVTWTEPADNGSPIIRYDAEPKKTSALWPRSVDDGRTAKCPPANLCGPGSGAGARKSHTVTELDSGEILIPGEAYDVRVRECNAIGCGEWAYVSATVPGPTLTVDKTIVEIGKTFNVTADHLKVGGTYVLRYEQPSLSTDSACPDEANRPSGEGEVTGVAELTAMELRACVEDNQATIRLLEKIGDDPLLGTPLYQERASVSVQVTGKPVISISADTDVVEEGAVLTLTFEAQPAPSSNLTVEYEIYKQDGSMTPANGEFDGVSSPLTVTIQAAEANVSSTIVTLTAKDEMQNEADEIVVISVAEDTVGDEDYVVSDTDDSVEVTIRDWIEVPIIADNHSTVIEGIEAESSVSNIWLRLLDVDSGRAYAAEFRKKRDSVLITIEGILRDPSEVGSSQASSTSTYVNVGRGKFGDSEEPARTAAQFVWVEDRGPTATTREIVFTPKSLTTGPATFEVTVSKPDFAIVGKPTLSADTDRWNLSVSIHNSSRRSGIDFTVIDGETVALSHMHVQCSRGGINTSVDGRTSVVDLGVGPNISLGISTLCRGWALSAGDNINVAIRLNAVSVVRPDVVNIAGLPPTRLSQAVQLALNTWPFSVTTLWHPPGTQINGGGRIPVAGGLQMNAKPGLEPCTASLALKLRPLSGSAEFQAVTTTAHCAELPSRMVAWYFGETVSRADINDVLLSSRTELGPVTFDSTTRVKCGAEELQSGKKCRRGDQSYARVSNSLSLDFTNGAIVRPAEKNTVGSDKASTSIRLSLDHFALSSGNGFLIVGARPPENGEIVHKVGRTTGWTSGEVDTPRRPDSTCPGSPTNYADNLVDGSQFACLTRATYESDTGDSGAPVFFMESGSSSEVTLVGIHHSGAKDVRIQRGYFIPIDRVYADALSQGYDWEPAVLRPIPVPTEIKANSGSGSKNGRAARCLRRSTIGAISARRSTSWLRCSSG